ncbi:MAG TPA: PEP-CTERM sorting domain-containing protein, partial [Lacipirellulaceae bacterium]|nr:PEP-CTERM sorting domain-containing protein [Lacipirellulaceae bacterium]
VGQGTLELINGGQLSENPNSPAAPRLEVFVGEGFGSQGFVNLRGNGSLLRSNRLVIGGAGFGQMSMTTRARTTTVSEAIIGELGTGNDIGVGFVSVDGQLTRWTIGSTAGSGGSPGLLVVGAGGRGGLNITNQGEVRVTDDSGLGGSVIIGQFANSIGEVNVSGQFSQLWSFGTITVGGLGRGILRASDGGLVRANQDINIGVDGVLEISGGSVVTPITPANRGIYNSGVIQTNTGRVGQIDSRVFNQVTGEIRAAGTADRVRERLIFTRQVTNDGLITSIGGEMEFTGGVINNGMIAGRDAIYRFRDPFTNSGAMNFSVGVSDVYGSVTNNGVLGVAHNTDVTFYDPVVNNGNLTVLPGGAAIFLDGLTLAASSALSLQLNQVASIEEIGQLQIVGSATLGGALSLVTFGGLNPQPGDSWQIISGTNVTGTFSSVQFPPAPGNNWSLDYTPNSVVLQYVAAPAFSGDFNGDNIVDGADLAIWEATFGMTVPPPVPNGDANGDGIVDGADLLIWQKQLGTSGGAAPAAGAVPEPASWALVLMAAAAGLRRRGRNA